MNLHLPKDYGNPEKAFAKYCLKCGQRLSFDDGGLDRWNCTCGWVHHDHPQPVANALVVVDKNRRNKHHFKKSESAIAPSDSLILAVQRKHPPFPGQWALAGGFVNSFEAPEFAARREILEELGLSICLLRFLGACHPLRNDPNRFAMNQIVASWLAYLDSDGEMVAQDDALTAEAYHSGNCPEFCFGSHNYVTKNWFAGKYDWGSGIESDCLAYENLNKDEDVHNCIRCSKNLTWNTKLERYCCEDTETCKWVYWNSPVPFSKAVLISGDNFILQKESELWVLPNMVIPAYHTPREAIEMQFDKGILDITTNLAAIKSTTFNHVEIVFAGKVLPNSVLAEKHREFAMNDLPDDFCPADRRIIEKFQSGYYEDSGSSRRL